MMPTRSLAVTLISFAVSLLASAALHAASFTPGNVAVYRVGSGSGSLANTGNPVFIDEYTPAGVLVQSIALPTAASSGVNQLVASGTATSEGFLTRSADGRYLVLTGYAATPPVTGLAGSSLPRTVGRIDFSGSVDTSTALTDYASGNNPRSAASSDGTKLWVTGGAGGIRFAMLGATTSTQLSTTVTNLRQVAIFGGQLYISTSSGSAVRIGTVGTGLPEVAGQTITNLSGIPTSGSPYAFFLADLDAGIPGVDTLYVASDDAGAVTKYSLIGGTWTANGTVGVAGDAYRGITGVVSGATVTLYATRKGGSGAAGGGELVSIVDASGHNGAFSSTVTLLATAAANTAFRGLALAPESGQRQVNLGVSANTAMEAAGTVITVTATADGPVSGAQSVALAVTGVNITGTDYSLSSSTITIPDGATSGSVTFTVLNDSDAEGPEIASLSISAPTSGIVLGATTSQSVAIEDDEARGVSLAVTTQSTAEGGVMVVTVTAIATGPVNGAQSVALAVTGTGITATDYSLDSSTITIANATSSGSVTFTVLDDADIEATEIATLTISGPTAGLALQPPVSRDITILDNDTANTPPTISCSVPAIAGAISDPTQPAFTCTVNDAQTAAGSLAVTPTSGNAAVVPNANLGTANNAGTVTVTVNPIGVGYATLTLTVSDGLASAQTTVAYAASAASSTPSTTRFHYGTSDGSTGVAIDANYMFVANDEEEVIRLYHRSQSGMPLAGFDFKPSLGLTDGAREVDIEAAAEVGSRIYWLGSHSNSSGGAIRVNRYRVFATDMSGSGAAATLSYVGRYDHLRTDLINWDSSNAHGLGANFFGLAASAASGVIPEAPDGSGFNLEGLVMAPDDTTAYLAFRAPIVPAVGPHPGAHRAGHELRHARRERWRRRLRPCSARRSSSTSKGAACARSRRTRRTNISSWPARPPRPARRRTISPSLPGTATPRARR